MLQTNPSKCVCTVLYVCGVNLSLTRGREYKLSFWHRLGCRSTDYYRTQARSLSNQTMFVYLEYEYEEELEVMLWGRLSDVQYVYLYFVRTHEWFGGGEGR